MNVYKSVGADQVAVGERVYFHVTLGDYTPAHIHIQEDRTTTHTMEDGNAIVYHPTERVYVKRVEDVQRKPFQS